MGAELAISPPSTLLAPGSVIGDRYEIVELVSYGAMGIVYRAWHRTLGIELAVKAMRAELGSEEFFRRFAEEARNAASLKSAHVARVFDFGRLDSGELYLVMELLRGEDLATVLAERGPLPVDLAVRLATQACEALGEAHAAGIVHRDLKPENLFLTHSPGGDPVLKVLDFGVSKRMQAAPRKASIAGAMGSPSYMSPEQLRCSRDVDCRADVWALGAVLFELLSGRPAFEGESIAEICTQVLHTRPPPLLRVRPEVGPALSGIVERCLETERERRFQTMGELAQALCTVRREDCEATVRPVALSADDAELPPIAGLRRWRLARAFGALALLAAICGAMMVGYFGPSRSLELARAGATRYLVGGPRAQRVLQLPVERPALSALHVVELEPEPEPEPEPVVTAIKPRRMKARLPEAEPPTDLPEELLDAPAEDAPSERSESR
jgi:serine/threonine-protein kinase